VKVRGYVKGVDYGLGQELTDCDSTWTAVLVDGAWRLLDVYWATCHRVHSGDSAWELIDDGQSDLSIGSQSSTPRGNSKVSKTEYAYNDYYFLTGITGSFLEHLITYRYPCRKGLLKFGLILFLILRHIFTFFNSLTLYMDMHYILVFDILLNSDALFQIQNSLYIPTFLSTRNGSF